MPGQQVYRNVSPSIVLSTVGFLGHADWHCFPYIIAIFTNGSIRRELANPRYIEDGHSTPVFCVLERATNLFLAFGVTGKIGAN
jgi:hypothetical protein